MRILVTGSEGFLGRALVARLRRSGAASLRLTDLKASRGVRGCDLRDGPAVRRLVRRCRPDLVFHLAGTTRRLDWDRLWDAHVRATINLLEALAADGQRKRVVCTGSAAEYGPAPRLPVTEDAATRPVSDYGRSKLAQTLAALSFSHQGLSVAVARLFNISGPGLPDHLSLGAFARQLAAASGGDAVRLRVGDLGPRRDYVDVRDAAAALAALGRAGEGVYNVCSGRSLPMRELLAQLAEQAGVRVAPRVESARLRRDDIPDMRGSARRLRRLTGWRPMVRLQRSLADTLAWHRSRGRGRP